MLVFVRAHGPVPDDRNSETTIPVEIRGPAQLGVAQQT